MGGGELRFRVFALQLRRRDGLPRIGRADEFIFGSLHPRAWPTSSSSSSDTRISFPPSCGSAASRVGMTARKDTLQQLIPIANRFIPRTGASTIVFGTILYLMMGNFDPQILGGTTWGRLMLASLILAVGLLVFGIGIVRRASERMLKHLNEDACTHGPEVAALQMTSTRGQLVALL